MVAVFPILCFAQSNTGQANSSIQNATSTNSLLRELKAMDSKLFDAIFKDCDLATLPTLLTDDFEFYHDKNGLMATNGAQFVEIIRKTCEGQKTGKEVRSRRELVSMAFVQVGDLTGVFAKGPSRSSRRWLCRANEAPSIALATARTPSKWSISCCPLGTPPG